MAAAMTAAIIAAACITQLERTSKTFKGGCPLPGRSPICVSRENIHLLVRCLEVVSSEAAW